jgi:hypothetical protein
VTRSGWDPVTRVGEITGCDLFVWTNQTYCTLHLEAHVAGGMVAPDDKTEGTAFGSLRLWENGAEVARSIKECFGSYNGPSGAYDVTTSDGLTWPNVGLAATFFWNSVPLSAKSKQDCSVVHGNFMPFNIQLTLEYRDYAWLNMNVRATRGSSTVKAYHNSTPSTDDFWDVTMTAFDFDEYPINGNVITIYQFTFPGGTNK